MAVGGEGREEDGEREEGKEGGGSRGSTYSGHALAVVHRLSDSVVLAVELPEEVKGNDGIDVDDNTRHENSHCKLGWRGEERRGGGRSEGEE